MLIKILSVIELLLILYLFYSNKKLDKKIDDMDIPKVDLKPLENKVIVSENKIKTLFDNDKITNKSIKELNDKVDNIKIPDIKPLEKQIKLLEDKIKDLSSGEIDIVDGKINGDLLVYGEIKAKGNITAFIDEEV